MRNSNPQVKEYCELVYSWMTTSNVIHHLLHPTVCSGFILSWLICMILQQGMTMPNKVRGSDNTVPHKVSAALRPNPPN